MRFPRIACALLLAGTISGLAAAPAQAQEYRYWSFWNSKGGSGGSGGAAGSWAYATEGPATARPADGAVEGFRFTVSADSAAAAGPRTAADFDAICQGTPAKENSKRVGVVIDFGSASDAPGGERPPKPRTHCAVVPEDASAGEVLAAVARPLRYDPHALLCAIADYPRSGCADRVGGSGDTGAEDEAGGKDEAAAGSGPDASAPSAERGSGTVDHGEDGGPSAGLLGGGAAVFALGAAAVWQARRRRG
ncbi:SCO2322 family protein [Streptomyces sp. NPDC017993]|uniref:SCO2322 family protein n=1 Tax=Streptomyces sp. NPDC017993 TaxID=3365027 RepID=UPI0037981425